MSLRTVALVLVALSCLGCSEAPPAADLVLTGGRVYTLDWPDPDTSGGPHEHAPHDENGWHPDATAVAIRNGLIQWVGGDDESRAYVAEGTRVIDLQGATVLPGFVDAHTHIVELGGNLSRIDLRGVETESEAIERVAAAAESKPEGEWLIGHGWDEGAWANRYPHHKALSEATPRHPVVLISLHGFAVWANEIAMRKAGLDESSAPPSGGTFVRDDEGQLSGIFLNRATTVMTEAIPAPSLEKLFQEIRQGSEEMIRSGYVAVHEAGVPRENLEAFQAMAARNELPLHVYVMLSARDAPLMKEWLAIGPQKDRKRNLTVRAVKAYYDGALGSRGARLLEDYADQPGHRGVSGADYGFDQELVAEMMRQGFQVGIHAIGDAGNREVIDFVESVTEGGSGGRHRIEHAQVLHPDDMKRVAALGIIASMQPPHAMEDKTWAEDRLGPDRIRGAYAWRTLRELGIPLAFSSDLPGSSYDIGYGLHSAVARQDRQGQPEGGWYPQEKMSPEEAVRGYTSWAAYSGFQEDVGAIKEGYRADLTILDGDPLVLGATQPSKLLDLEVMGTIVGGVVRYSRIEAK